MKQTTTLSSDARIMKNYLSELTSLMLYNHHEFNSIVWEKLKKEADDCTNWINRYNNLLKYNAQ